MRHRNFPSHYRTSVCIWVSFSLLLCASMLINRAFVSEYMARARFATKKLVMHGFHPEAMYRKGKQSEQT